MRPEDPTRNSGVFRVLGVAHAPAKQLSFRSPVAAAIGLCEVETAKKGAGMERLVRECAQAFFSSEAATIHIYKNVNLKWIPSPLPGRTPGVASACAGKGATVSLRVEANRDAVAPRRDLYCGGRTD